MLAVFASFPASNALGHQQVLLAFSTFADETTHNANEHKKFLEHVLMRYKKSWVNVAALIGDNVSVNQKLATDLYKRLIGCASHRYNLAIKDMINSHDAVFKIVNKLMGKLRYGLLAARLRKEAPLAAVQMNDTRWSSAFSMLKRYIELREILPRLNDATVDALMPTAPQNREIDGLFRMMVELEEIQLDLQHEQCTLLSTRDNFDVLLSRHPEMAGRLNADARIVHSPEFERAVVLIQDGRESTLSASEAASVAFMRKASDADSDVGEQTLLQSARKKRKLRDATAARNYLDTRFLLPTSNICERFFSKARNAIGDNRKSLSTENIGAQLFLHCNMHLWNILDVNSL